MAARSFSSVANAPRRFPRRLDRSGESQHGLCRRRWRPVAQPGRRHALGAPDEPAGVAVLSRERGQRRAVPRVRRPAGQQRLGGRFVLSRRREQLRAGRTCAAATASGCAKIRPTRIISMPKPQGGEIGRVNRYTHETRSIKPYPELRREEAALQLEHADSHEPE